MKGDPATVPATTGKPAGPGLSKLTRNPKVLAAGVVGVVGLAVLSRRGGGSSAAADAAPAQTGQLNPSQGGYYDSTANDVYNSLMGQIQALGMAQSSTSPGPSTPTPTPTTPATTTPPAGMSAHQAHLLHVAHVARMKPATRPAPLIPRRKPAPQLTAHQAHMAHLARMSAPKRPGIPEKTR